ALILGCDPRDLPDLHSFPTRRSSDLRPPARTSAPPLPSRMLLPSLPVMTLAPALPVPLMLAVPVSVRFSKLSPRMKLTEDWTVRSEEHTSELQSRENLVCRLLLEKKN